MVYLLVDLFGRLWAVYLIINVYVCLLVDTDISKPDWLMEGSACLVSCNWVFHMSNWQKVQLNTDLSNRRTRHLYTREMLIKSKWKEKEFV
jgi:hypothetical protein